MTPRDNQPGQLVVCGLFDDRSCASNKVGFITSKELVHFS